MVLGMSAGQQPTPESLEYWRDFLNGGHSREHRLRQVLKLLPGDPGRTLALLGTAHVGPLYRS